MPEKDEIILATILCIFIVLATAYTALSKDSDKITSFFSWKIHRKSYPELKTAKDLLNPRTNVRIGTEIFARYYAQKKNVRNALIRYNGGSASFARRVLKTIKRLEQ